MSTDTPAHTAEDARNAHQHPKIELYGESLFVVARTAEQNLPLLTQGPGYALYAVRDAIPAHRLVWQELPPHARTRPALSLACADRVRADAVRRVVLVARARALAVVDERLSRARPAACAGTGW
ncbi:hypothetical protein [Metallibacterium sp.]|uniref:hypothetical protein n=1 Tax=Metallibacterium sp. TaxID=2940281 RepID=UPI002637C288|nr:hypothetical protein [Metallibacterium sp.]